MLKMNLNDTKISMIVDAIAANSYRAENGEDICLGKDTVMAALNGTGEYEHSHIFDMIDIEDLEEQIQAGLVYDGQYRRHFHPTHLDVSRPESDDLYNISIDNICKIIAANDGTTIFDLMDRIDIRDLNDEIKELQSRIDYVDASNAKKCIDQSSLYQAYAPHHDEYVARVAEAKAELEAVKAQNAADHAAIEAEDAAKAEEIKAEEEVIEEKEEIKEEKEEQEEETMMNNTFFAEMMKGETFANASDHDKLCMLRWEANRHHRNANNSWRIASIEGLEILMKTKKGQALLAEVCGIEKFDKIAVVKTLGQGNIDDLNTAFDAVMAKASKRMQEVISNLKFQVGEYHNEFAMEEAARQAYREFEKMIESKKAEEEAQAEAEAETETETIETENTIETPETATTTKKTTYDRSRVMKLAWAIKRMGKDFIFGECLKMAWQAEKNGMSDAEVLAQVAGTAKAA